MFNESRRISHMLTSGRECLNFRAYVAPALEQHCEALLAARHLFHCSHEVALDSFKPGNCLTYGYDDFADSCL